jgi:ribosome biogenesis GTPase A
MARAEREIMDTYRKEVDFVVEVRDARLPYATAADSIVDLVGNKPRLILLNKSDLACPRATGNAVKRLRRDYDNVFATSIRSNLAGKSASKIVSALRDKVPQRFRTLDALVMICGVPNVGKSTVINAIRNVCMRRESRHTSTRGKRKKWGRGVRTGRLPGVTTSVSKISVSSDPPIAMVDTPGILLPNIGSVEMGLNLALTGAVRDEVVGHETLALYLLDMMLQSNEIKSIRKLFKIDISSSKVRRSPVEVLDDIMIQRGHDQTLREESSRNALCVEILRHFRGGALGRFSLE